MYHLKLHEFDWRLCSGPCTVLVDLVESFTGELCRPASNCPVLVDLVDGTVDDVTVPSFINDDLVGNVLVDLVD